MAQNVAVVRMAEGILETKNKREEYATCMTNDGT
jgi:hypothetical protein